MKGKEKFIVNEEITLLSFLLMHLKGKSRNNVKSILKRGQVTVDDSVCTDYSRILRMGQSIEVLKRSDGFKMTIPVIYEDNDIIVIDKPPGMLSISTDKEREKTAYHIVTDFVKSIDKSTRIFVVHRLDRETSGILLFAKSEGIKRALQDGWDNLVTWRGYIAVIEGKVAKAHDTITSWLKQSKTLVVYSSSKERDGKKAITNYKAQIVRDNYSLLEISLDTGRKNQIRVHMSDIGHPITGDKKYGAKSNPFGRLGLHANRLTVRHPITGKELTFESKMPEVFMKVFK